MSQRVLVLLSSANRIPLREGGVHPTGVFLGELTEPLKPLLDQGYTLDFVTPDGQPTVIDSNSENLIYWGFSKKKLQEGRDTLEKLRAMGMDTPMKLAELLNNSELLKSYTLLFVPGGHSPMTDLLHTDWTFSEALNAETGALLKHFHDRSALTALICHGPAVLAAARNPDGSCIYSGYQMTCVTGVSEWITEDAPLLKAVHGHLKDYPENILKRSGAILHQNPIPMIPHLVEDRELITGQDPYAAEALGKLLLKRLEALS